VLIEPSGLLIEPRRRGLPRRFWRSRRLVQS
jgi:hypothetical protein